MRGGSSGSAVDAWAGIVLAAGRSRRMGRIKPLLPFGETHVLGHVLSVAHAAGLDPIAVVVGHDAEAIASRLPAGVPRVENPAYATGGMISSIRCGLRAVSGARGFVVLLGDQPTIGAEVIRALRCAWEADGRPDDRFYVPTFAGRRGHPVVIGAALVPRVAAGPCEGGLRRIMREEAGSVREVPVDEAGILMDMDTEEAYERALVWYRERARRGAGGRQGAGGSSAGWTDASTAQ